MKTRHQNHLPVQSFDQFSNLGHFLLYKSPVNLIYPALNQILRTNSNYCFKHLILSSHSTCVIANTFHDDSHKSVHRKEQWRCCRKYLLAVADMTPTFVHFTILYSTELCSTVQYSTVQYSTEQYSTVQYNTVQYSTVQYSTVQYNTVLCSTVQYSTVQYSTV